MADKIAGSNGAGTGSAQDTREVTITVRNDIPDATVRAITAPLRAGTNNFVVGNLADLQRMGAVEVAKDGGQNLSDPIKVNPNVPADEAKAGAERTLTEDAENAEATAELAATAPKGTVSATAASKSSKK